MGGLTEAHALRRSFTSDDAGSFAAGTLISAFAARERKVKCRCACLAPRLRPRSGRPRRRCAQDRAPVAIRCAARHRFCRRRKRAFPSSSTPPALACARSQDRGAAPAWRGCSTRRCLPVRGTGVVAPLLRAGRATPIEIAAFPSKWCRRAAVTGLSSRPGGLMHMIGEPERKPLKLGGHQASYAAASRPSPPCCCAGAATGGRPARASCPRVAGRVMQ